MSRSAITVLKDGDSVLHDPCDIAEHVTNYFSNLFGVSAVGSDFPLMNEVIPSLVNEDMNNMLTVCPSVEEIKAVVFNLSPNSSPGSDGFGGFFYQTYWEVIKDDVINVVLQFYTKGWIMKIFNVSTLVLIPKVNGASSLDKFRPIAMANFKFKIISKILVDRLASIMPILISNEQKGFVKGRSIHDGIRLASEAFNILDKKSFGGNVAIKVDVIKAFDTINWKFLLQVLSSFGFSKTFVDWIEAILSSAHITVSVNGNMFGYFSCARGVRQGDPLSPLWFCLAEEVISRGISNLVNLGKVSLMKSVNVSFPSHTLYADDILVFCKGTSRNIKALFSFFATYANASGQVFSTVKSSLFARGLSASRINALLRLTGFTIGNMPFNYLGTPTFKGSVRKHHLQPIADRILAKFAAWKGSLLSIAGRVVLVYSWPVKLLRIIEKASRNFIWSGSISKKKVVTVAWKFVCQPKSNGGLDLRSLVCLNQAYNLKSCWEFMSSTEAWARILRNRGSRDYGIVRHHIQSSIWKGIKEEYHSVLDNTSWSSGNGRRIKFWLDSWSGTPFINDYDAASLSALGVNTQATVADIFSNFGSNVLAAWLDHFPFVEVRLSGAVISDAQFEDVLCWKHSINGSLSLKDAYCYKLKVLPPPLWVAAIWNSHIPPSKSLLIWRVLHDKIPTDDHNVGAVSSLLQGVCYVWCNFLIPIFGTFSLKPILLKKLSRHNMFDFDILKAFQIRINPPKAPLLREIFWNPPPVNWMKCNVDGSFVHNTPSSGCGGIFRNCSGDFCLAFTEPLSWNSSLLAEFCGVLCGIELAKDRGWTNLWMEFDSSVVVKAFSQENFDHVSWQLRNRWLNCIKFVLDSNFIISHICREGNSCAYFFANLGRTSNSFTLFDSLPVDIRIGYVKNRIQDNTFEFLGFSLGGSHRVLSWWEPTLKKLRSRLGSWKGRMLSLGGRITLIKSVLSSLAIFQLSFFVAPRRVIKEFERIQNNFLWGCSDVKRKITWVKWETLCLSKENGGLGFKKFNEFNTALLFKWK
ncbi:uncharacterized protein LOC131600410 [Vicia villosa]|uniref:uncharacterized protein LOC131600410 n=1 Tax=Vicia villosa TaxID=3911 RepID=UPI00273BB1AF|nr:uncharacterized protein LOC131600410 [Vicia villosa]